MLKTRAGVFLFFLHWCILLPAQQAARMLELIKGTDRQLSGVSWNSVSARAISNRAMNIFLADKNGYGGGPEALSFFTNNISFNSTSGLLSICHSFQPQPGDDDPIRHLFNAGMAVRPANSFAQHFSDYRFDNEIFLTANYKWIGKTSTRFRPCPGHPACQKITIDALRAALVAGLQRVVEQTAGKDSVLLEKSEAVLIAERDADSILAVAIGQQFAEKQAALLSRTGAFGVIRESYSTLSISVPVFFPGYFATAAYSGSLEHRHPWPLEVSFSHTRLVESSHAGRLFLSAKALARLNNSKLGYSVTRIRYADYKAAGGSGIITGAEENAYVYLGIFRQFVTPALSASLIYYPHGSHIGLSLLAEQSFGPYHFFNAKIGIPVVVINAKKTPAFMLEVYLLLTDIARSATLSARQAGGLSIALPLSRLIY